ncbi:MAG: hypothetical protein HY825_16265 [Acidobacteria bacterium]|nr:hypothetical protein [Acidobacteriota bacterium]
MRAKLGWIAVACACVSWTACGKKEPPAPGPSVPPAVATGAPVAPVEPPAAGDAAAAPAAVDTAPAAPPPEPLAPPDAGVAPAEPPPDAGPAPEVAAIEPPPSSAFATELGEADGLRIESIVLCSAIEERVCVGEKREFEPGEMVWALLRLANTERVETELRVAYLEAGGSPAPGHGLRLRVPAQERYTTFSKAAKQTDGLYDVIVTTADGDEIARAGFQVGVGGATAPADADAAPPAVVQPPPPTAGSDEPFAPSSSTGLGVASIELCRTLENRRCAEPATTFAPRELVWALLRVTNPERVDTEVRVSYLAAGGAAAPGEGLLLNVPPQAQYTTFAKAGKGSAGQYEVVVCAPDGRELARAAFEVR